MPLLLGSARALNPPGKRFRPEKETAGKRCPGRLGPKRFGGGIQPSGSAPSFFELKPFAGKNL